MLVDFDRTSGTNIGNMTDGGGVAAAFDGVTSQTLAASAQQVLGQPAWVGKTLPRPLRFGRAVFYGSNNQGFSGDDGPMSIRVYGKNGSVITDPQTDGSTVIGTLAFTDTSDESAGRVVDSTDVATFWDHIAFLVTGHTYPGAIAEIEWEYVVNPVPPTFLL